MTATLIKLEGLPDGLLDCSARDLAARLGGPALIHVRGEREPPLFVSVLLHGNETSGWEGVRRLLQESQALPRSLILFIGNVAAAASGVRTLAGQQDYNRIWRRATGAEGELAAHVLSALRGRRLFAAVDLHNNTGHNPHYTVLTDLTPPNLGLAYLFCDKAVYIRQPDTVMTRALAELCPAAALELGPIGDPRGEERAFDFVKRCLVHDVIPPVDPTRLELFETQARVHVPDEVVFSFAGLHEPRPLILTGGLEGVNFHELAAGTEFARTTLPLEQALKVLDVSGRNVTSRFFTLEDDCVRLSRPIYPAMYTTDPVVVRQDCLCYFMKRRMLDGIPFRATAATSPGNPSRRLTD